MKEKYKNLKHIICLAHNLSNLLVTIKNHYNFIGSFGKYFISTLKNNTKNKILWKETTALPLPKLPIDTRWGSWMSFLCFIKNNKDQIDNYIGRLKYFSYNNLKDLWTSSKFKNELDDICRYEFISEKIILLEKKI